MSFIIFPCHLFKNKEILNQYDKIYIIEHPIYFTKYKYHKLKLMLHRASMRKYYDELDHRGKKYVKFDSYKTIKGDVVFYDPIDHSILKEYHWATVLSSPGFICSNDLFDEYYKEKDTLINSVFYRYMRQKLNILPNVKSYDKQNRKPFPSNIKADGKYVPKVLINDYTIEAKKYVLSHFPDNPGSTDNYLPIDSIGARKLMKKFMRDRFSKFGPYEDAVSKTVIIGYHSGLSALLNIGLLTASEVLSEALKHRGDVPIASLEGYVRQLFWREYMCYCYKYHATELRRGNFFKNKKSLAKYWYNPEKEEGPGYINFLIKKAWKYGYLHHIERLMFIGNYMLITETTPSSVFKWFMSFFIDAISSWVMYGNVYGMSQFSCGRLIMTRPYICSSNYILKMSDFNKEEMGDLDDRYREFIQKHRNKLLKFGRTF